MNRFINEETDDEVDLLPEHQDQLKHVRCNNKCDCMSCPVMLYSVEKGHIMSAYCAFILLLQYTIKEGGIPEEHPGEPVFDDSRFGQIYSLPDHCRLKEDFNFLPSSSSIDQLLVNTSQGTYQCLL